MVLICPSLGAAAPNPLARMPMASKVRAERIQSSILYADRVFKVVEKNAAINSVKRGTEIQ